MNVHQCPKCNKEFPAEARFCDEDGAKLIAQKGTPIFSKDERLLVLAIIVGIIIVIVGQIRIASV